MFALIQTLVFKHNMVTANEGLFVITIVFCRQTLNMVALKTYYLYCKNDLYNVTNI